MSLIFRPIEIMSKKARRNDVDFLLIEGKLIRHRCVDNQNNIKKVHRNDMEIC